MPRFIISPSTRTKCIWLVRRIALSVALLFIVSVLIFAATQALPGDVAVMILGREATPDQIALLRSQLHLDQPLVFQFVDWLTGVLVGDFGDSIAARMPVADLIGPRGVISFTIVAASMALSIPLSVVLGISTAYYKDSLFDRCVLGISLAINALPEFVLGVLLVVLLATSVFHLLPAVSLLSPSLPLYDQIDALVLPVTTLVLLQSTYLYRLIRGSMIDVLATDYIQFAELKGLSTKRILFRHALPNAAVPAIQAAATVFAYSVGGVVVIEFVFGLPGIGTALTDAVGNRDIPVVQFIVLLIASTFFMANIVADVATAALTPPRRGGGVPA